MISGKKKNLQRLVTLLGWGGLEKFTYIIPHNELVHTGQTIVWYECGMHSSVWLQINESPSPQACVFAIRYRICTGWHRITLSNRNNNLKRESSRLHDWLSRSWFTTSRARQKFRRIHPECAGYSWRKIRSAGYPHRYEHS